MSLLAKIWKDPVWSKVIATGILAAVAALWLWLGNLLQLILDFLKMLQNFIILYGWQVLAVVALILACVFWVRSRILSRRLAEKENIRQNQVGQTSSSSPVDWLKKLSDEDLARYAFLFWFPVKDTLYTEAYRKIGVISHYGDISFDGIPDLIQLFEKAVLKKKQASLSDYVLEMNPACFEFLAQKLAEYSASKDAKMKKSTRNLIENFAQRSFSSFFPQARNRQF